MKKIYLMFIITLGFACSSNYDDFNALTSVLENETQLQFASKPSSISWNIQLELIKKYKSNPNQPILISDKIELLQNLADSLPSFVALKSNNYSVITKLEVQEIMFNYENIYQNITASEQFLDVLDSIIEKNMTSEEIDYIISNQNNLTVHEKNILFFIALNCEEEGDVTWKKRRGIAIIEGYRSDNAQAIFNATLFSLLK